ncbi:MAG: biotin transporter BioY [Oscillospiraceae bacterium]|nr:biotin transporter BioY [Oscillospiraceae bacterium]
MKAKSITLCGLFAALMVLCAWISIPVFDTAITLQSFALVLALLLLGGKRSTATITVYLMLGAVGAPVFSGFQSGFGILLGPTGGYLWGFLVGALVYWAYTAICGETHRLPGVILAMLVCYGCGVGWYYFAYAQGAAVLVFIRYVLPCLLPDAAKIWLAFTLAKTLRQRLS